MELDNDTQHSLALATSAAIGALVTSRLLRGLFSSSPSRTLPASDASQELNTDPELFALQCFTRLTAAFGPSGLNAPGTSSGAMIASPSRPGDRWNEEDENENYFFQWPRDSGICVRTLVRRWRSALDGKQVGAPGGRAWLRAEIERGRKGQRIGRSSAPRRAAAEDDSADQLEKIIQDFARMNHHLQTVENPSGTFETGGLGEPKLLVDGTAFTKSWGRPQNDGPALRSLALLSYAFYVMTELPSDGPSRKFVSDVLFEPSAADREGDADESHRVINADLDYIRRAWKESTFEPWEEVRARAAKPDPSEANAAPGGHFYVLMVQRQALLLGARFATFVGDSLSAKLWSEAAAEISEHLELFWNPDGHLGLEGAGEDGELPEDSWHDPRRHLLSVPQELLRRPHIAPTLNRKHGQQKPLQVDTQVLLAFTHGGDGTFIDAPDDSCPWAPWSDRCLATLDRLVEVFAIVYDLNAGRNTTTDGVLCGRYPEDIYNGKDQSVGHPWFICTHAIAEVLALGARHFARTGSITTTEYAIGFFRRFRPSAEAQATYTRGGADGMYEALLRGMRRMARAYLDNARSYAGPEGRMDEQIERTSGRMRGARELTWSYASLLSAWDAVTEQGPDLRV